MWCLHTVSCERNACKLISFARGKAKEHRQLNSCYDFPRGSTDLAGYGDKPRSVINAIIVKMNPRRKTLPAPVQKLTSSVSSSAEARTRHYKITRAAVPFV